jgi:hypothetical protein
MIRSHAIVISQHLFLVMKLCIGAEVVGKVCSSGLLIPIEGWDFTRVRRIAKFLGIHGEFRILDGRQTEIPRQA